MKQEENYTNRIFFFDSYAFFEIIKGNQNYEKYANASIVTTKLNLFELYNGTLEILGEETADVILEKYYEFVTDFDQDIIKEAAKLRIIMKKRNVSMTDCIGYILSKQLGIKFLTGDKEFENLENVEFVK